MARSFDGSTQHLDGTFAAFPTTNAVTFACWLFPTSAETTDVGLVCSRSGALGGLIYGTAPGQPLCCCWGSVGFDRATGLTPVQNEWNFAAGVVTPTQLLTYLGQAGGASLSSFAFSTSNVASTSAGWSIGRDPAGNLFAGRIAEAAIWNASLTQAELTALLLGAPVRRVRRGSLIGYWPLLGLSGTSTEPDLSGNGTSMTLTGAPPLANHAPVTLFTAKARAQVDTGTPRLIPWPRVVSPPPSPAFFE